MVEPTPLTLHRGYGCYSHQFSFPLFHILPSPLPPSMANSKPITVNTTNGYTQKKKISTKRKSNHQLHPQKEKISNHQYHHQPHKPTSITAQASNHNYKHRKPKHTNTKSSDRWSKIANLNQQTQKTQTQIQT